MKTTNKTMWLTIEVAKTLVNKVISWRAPMDEENWDDYDTPKFFGGKCIIKEINSDNRRALVCETISGNDLSYAILEDEELQPVNGSETRFSLSPSNITSIMLSACSSSSSASAVSLMSIISTSRYKSE